MDMHLTMKNSGGRTLCLLDFIDVLELSLDVEHDLFEQFFNPQPRQFNSGTRIFRTLFSRSGNTSLCDRSLLCIEL